MVIDSRFFSRMQMKREIREALQYCPNLPTPPGIAMQIVELGRDPDVDLTSLARVLARDPALASRVLRASNSALFAQRRRSENLRQALVVIGLNATMTLALSFSLAETLSDGDASQAAVKLVWRRAMISATASRLLGERLRYPDLEELFLAALLQDIGILALDAALPDIYRPLIARAADHDSLVRIEREELGADHGEAGTWLMSHWGLPERLASIASAAHDPNDTRLSKDIKPFVNCVAVAGKIADMFISGDQVASTNECIDAASRHLGLGHEVIEPILERLGEILPEVEALYETEIMSQRMAAGVIDQAREILAARNLNLIHQVAEQQHKVQEMERTTQHLRETASRDALTGLYNRGRFDEVLAAEFKLATENGWPLTLGFIDLDHFKTVNDTHGHLAGDALLAHLAKLFGRHLREHDLVMRYGGDEFVALLPGIGLESALKVFDRLRDSVASEVHEGSGGTKFRATVSIGLAAHMDGNRRLGSPVELVRAADRALYEAKGSGRDRIGVLENDSAA
jgi:diguanylate cyclase (GGDEF)-like protein